MPQLILRIEQSIELANPIAKSFDVRDMAMLCLYAYSRSQLC